MQDVSAFGLIVQVRASITFPVGFEITQFAGDADPFDIPSLQIGDGEMDINGNLVTYGKAMPPKLTLNVVPFSEEDTNLQIVATANRPGKGKLVTRDIITLVGLYPSGRSITFTGGKMTDFPPGNSAASTGKLKSKAYTFMFEGVIYA